MLSVEGVRANSPVDPIAEIMNLGRLRSRMIAIVKELRDANVCAECGIATSVYLAQFAGEAGWSAICYDCAKAIKASGRGRLSLRPLQF